MRTKGGVNSESIRVRQHSHWEICGRRIGGAPGHAARGYRYVGYIPTNINNYGKITDLDLVFERDA